MRGFLTCLLALSLLAPAWAAGDFEASVEALNQGHDQEALAACQRLDEAGEATFGSLYNEGLALRNLGQPARARAAFERALLLNPHDLATRRRLQEVETKLDSKVATLNVRGTPWWKPHEAELMVVLPGLIMLVLAGVARAQGKRPGETPMLVLVVCALGLLTLVAWTAPARERAIVVDKSAALLAEPAPGKAGEALPAGVMVDILERSDHYLKVRLGDDRTGWLRGTQVVELAPPQATPTGIQAEDTPTPPQP